MVPFPFHHRMSSPISLSGLALACWMGSIAQASPLEYSITGQPTANFKFQVTVFSVPGQTQDLQARLKVDPQDLTTASGEVEVDLRHLDTGIALRNEHARNHLAVTTHPSATFKLDHITGIKKLLAGQSAQGFAEGTFTLKGISKPLKAPIDLKFDGQKISVNTHFELVFKDHDIDVPGSDPSTDVVLQFVLAHK